MRLSKFLICLLLLGGATAAQATLFGDDEARAKIVDQQKQILQLQTQVQALQSKLDDEQKQRSALEARLSALEGQLKNQSLEILNQIDQQTAAITQIKGQLEVVTHAQESSQQQQHDVYSDLDARLQKLEKSAADTSAKPAASSATAGQATSDAGSPPTTQAPAPAPVDNTAEENKAYEAAHTYFKAGNYGQSASAFEKFLDTYPNSKLAGNAQYWLGYAKFSQHDYKAAISAQQKLIKQYPDHPKAPDAMYNIANSQIQLSDIDGARQTLKALVAKYPISDAAGLAKKRLAQLEALKTKN
ncbi:MAG TPA: tol-pal system protein YbgF [Methylophilaceae bacterium]